MDPPTHCRNCGTPLVGSYCSECGQSDADYDVPIGLFAKEFISESFDLDSRLRATMGPLFFKPGLVAKEYVEGHRARFVPPVRLYVFASFALFLLLSLTPSTVNVVTTEDPEAGVATDSAAVAAELEQVTEVELSESLRGRFARGLAQAAEDPDEFSRTFLNRLAQAMFLLLPFFALLLKLAYRQRLYVHHLVFTIYFHAFAFLLFAIVAAPQAIYQSPWTAVTQAGVLWIPVHQLVGMRRFYGEGWTRTGLKYLAVTSVYALVGIATVMGLLVAGLIFG